MFELQMEQAGPARGAGFLFPVQALSRVFRGKFLAELARACGTEALAGDPLAGDVHAQRERETALRRCDWVVYAKTPLAGPAAVLGMLHRPALATAPPSRCPRSQSSPSVG